MRETKEAKNFILMAAILAMTTSIAHAQIKVGVVTSATGPTSAVGISQKKTVALLPKTFGLLNVEYITLDDASDSTQTVQQFKKLISDDHVDAIIGPSGSPKAVAVIQFAAEAHTPMLAPVVAVTMNFGPLGLTNFGPPPGVDRPASPPCRGAGLSTIIFPFFCWWSEPPFGGPYRARSGKTSCPCR